MATATAIRPLRAAIIAALKAAETDAGNAVFTPPIRTEENRFPRIVIDGYNEDSSNFFGRPGNRVRCLVKGQAKASVTGGDSPREALYEQVHAALDHQALSVTGHLLLEGTLRRTNTYLDPDGTTLHFVATYEGMTRKT